MSTLALGALLVASLIAGFAAGWVLSGRTGIRSPNAAVTFLLLLAGSLGGPAVTYAMLGDTPLSYMLALLAAGFPTGISFRPMAERQGAREW